MTWWHRLRRRRQIEEQLEKELRFHLDQHAAELIASGCDPEEARRLARIALGGPEQVKESCRDARGTRWLEDLWQDLGYAVRSLRQRPGFAMAALCTLALGIGATTIMFTTINGVLLRPLPFPAPSRLLAVHGRSNGWNVAIYGEQYLTYPDFLDCQRQSRSLDMAGWVYDNATMSEPGEAAYVTEFEATSNLFSVLGVPLYRGRAFLPEEDRMGGAPVAILSYELWQRRFGGSAGAIGRTLVLEGKRYTVVGITPAGLGLDGDRADVYTPLGQDTASYLHGRNAHPVRGVGRLRAGATLPQAQTELTLIGRRLAAQYPDTNKGRSFFAASLQHEWVQDTAGDVRSTLWLLLGAVSLVLLIACVNVASLLLARAISRQRELAMRAALGASRTRLMRQCLTESALLGLSGGLLGVVLAADGVPAFARLWPGGMPRAEAIQLDGRVLLFACAVSLACGFLFGLAPALRVPVRSLAQALRAGARSVGRSSRRLHSSFVIAEIALAVVLLVSAGMLGRTLRRLASLDPGVNIHNVLVSRMALSPAVLASPARTRVAWKEALDNARQVPGVQSSAIVDTVPMREGNNQIGYWTSAAMPPKGQMPYALATSVTPDYFTVMGIPLREGRVFSERDRMGSEPVVVIDEVLARHAFGSEDAVGKRLWIPDMPCARPNPSGPGGATSTFVDCSQPYTVVGVVGHVRYWGLANDDQAQVRAEFYYPFAQVADPFVRRWSELMSVAVRTSVPPMSVLKPLKQALRGAANDQVLYAVHTLEQLASDSIALQRFLLLVFSIFAGLALLLACVGIYGVLSYVTGQRVPEFGLRMALGASPGDVLRFVLRQSLRMVLVGVALGAAAAFGAARLLEHLVAGVSSIEPWTFASMICLLVAAALFASYLPARRASQVDPIKALRQE